MQSFTDNGFGCAIPVPVVRQFLDDVSDGRHDGIPRLGVGYQSLENPALRASLRVPQHETGVLVTHVLDRSPAADVLQPSDVLLAIDGQSVADDGTIKFRPRERTNLAYATDLHQVGSRVTVRYLRDGEIQNAEIQLTLARGGDELVPHLFDTTGQYYVFGGLVFVALTRDYISAAGSRHYLSTEVTQAPFQEPQSPGEQVVVLAEVLRGDVNRGYEGFTREVIRSLDGERILGLADLATRVEAHLGRFLTFGFGGGRRITLAREDAVRATPELLGRYGLAADRSQGLETTVRTAGGAPATPRRATLALGQ
jgi:hypothetical protein